jgi:hypothetical protein
LEGRGHGRRYLKDTLFIRRNVRIWGASEGRRLTVEGLFDSMVNPDATRGGGDGLRLNLLVDDKGGPLIETPIS